MANGKGISKTQVDIDKIFSKLNEIKDFMQSYQTDAHERDRRIYEIEVKLNKYDDYFKLRNEIKNWLIGVLSMACASMITFILYNRFN